MIRRQGSGIWHIPSIAKQVANQEYGTTPATPQLSLPVNDYRCLHALLTDLFRRYVVPQSIEGPTDEGRLSIEAGPQGRQGLRWGQQESGPKGVLQSLSQSGLTCDGKRKCNKELSTKQTKKHRLCTFYVNEKWKYYIYLNIAD